MKHLRSPLMKILFPALYLLAAGTAFGSGHLAWNYSDLESTPIQHGGRVKPFEAFARETALFITGSRSLEGMGSSELLLAWISDPKTWEERALIQVGREDTKRQLGIELTRNRFSLKELLHGSALPQYASQISSTPVTPGQKPTGREQELRSVLDRIGFYRALTSGEAWSLVPPDDKSMSGISGAAWESLVGPKHPVRQAFAQVVKAYVVEDRAAFESSVQALRSEVVGRVPGWNDGVSTRVTLERGYLKFRPFLWSWILYLVAAVLFGLSRSRKRLEPWALGVTAGAFGIHLVGMLVRSYIAGRPPVSNMYESVIWVSFGVVFFAAILYRVQRQTTGFWAVWAGSVVAALTLIAADLSPAVLDPTIKPLVPVLRSNFWLTIHVLTITLGYAALALTLGIADVSLFQQVKRAPSKVIAGLNALVYRAMQFGVVLLAAGTILGGVWADYSWGRFWGWDPKEVWALIALLSYLVVLHGRFTGWMGQLGFAAVTVVAFLSVVMAWYGVNFVLGVGLHSYGFAAGGRGWVFGAVALQLLYVGVCAGLVTRRKR